MIDLSKDIAWIKKYWDKIPDSFKVKLNGGRWDNEEDKDQLIDGLTREEHVVILLLDRQKPSVDRCYDFDEERISVNKEGTVVWGFDSGCSCPSPWDDSYPGCYDTTRTWKEFTLNESLFDNGAFSEVADRIKEIKDATRKASTIQTV